MKTSEWLSLAKEDVISATTEVKYLFEFLNQNLEDGYINNPVSIEETSKYFKDYLYKHRNHIVLYNDYLEMRKSFNTKEYPLYPKRLLELHNELSLKIEYEKNLLLENQINKVIKKYKSLEFDSLDFKFFIPSVCQMIDYSNELNLCIKSANYIQKVAEEKCLLLFCEKKDDPSKMDKYACELAVSNDGFKIVQFHGFNNDINVSNMYLDQRERLLNTLKTKLYLRGLLVC